MDTRKFRSAPRAETIDTDYTHIKRDLRRILFIALGFSVALVVLSFFLQ